MPIKKKIPDLRPAFDEVAVYPFAVLGVLCAPVVAQASANRPVHLQLDWAALIIALVITAALVIASELRGTREQKREGRIRLSRYAFAFLLGLFWRLAIPLIKRLVLGIFSGGAA